MHLLPHQNNYDIDQPDIVDLLVNDFPTTLYKWQDLYPTGLPIFTRHIDCGTQDVFVSRNMLQQDCHKPCWKERFFDGQPFFVRISLLTLPTFCLHFLPSLQSL